MGALELKVLGRNADEFATELRPVFDSTDNYTAELLVPVAPIGTITNPATSALAGEVVPAGEIWRVRSVHVQAAVLAADAAKTYSGTINLTPPSAAVLHVLAVGTLINAQTTGDRYFSYYLPRPLLLMPGWRLGVGVFVSATPAVSTAIAMVALVEKIKE